MNLNEEKLLMTLFCVVMVVAVAIVATLWVPALQTLFSTICGAITGHLAIYSGSNLTNKYIDNKYGSDTPPPPQDNIRQ